MLADRGLLGVFLKISISIEYLFKFYFLVFVLVEDIKNIPNCIGNIN